ncbi:MAG: HD domain-containing phosphohydrolase [Flexilinea sp.]
MKKLLIVDDVPQNLYVLDVLLKTNGYEVKSAVNGIDALEIARNDPPDMIISDILMPGMDGFSLCRIWKADEKLKNIPFIFYTATYTDAKDERFAMSLGADRFLIKPLEIEVFLQAIQDVFMAFETKKQTDQQKNYEKDDNFYKDYNEILFYKLEEKMQQLQKSYKRLTILYQTSSELHTMKPTKELVHSFLRTIVETDGCQQANYFYYNEKQGQLTLSISYGLFNENTTKAKDTLVFKLGERRGLVGLVAQTGMIRTVMDTTKEPDWITLDPTIRSAFFIPVLFEKKLLGVIGLFNAEKGAFGEEAEYDLTMLANTLAIAIVNNRNLEKIKYKLAQVSVLHEIGMAVNRSMNLQDILNIFLEKVMSLLKIDAADILIFQSKTQKNEFASGRGFTTSAIENDEVRQGESLDKKVTLDNSPIIISDLSKQAVSPAFKQMWEVEEFLAYCGVPLITKGNVIGILELYSRTSFSPDQEWLEFLETLAGQAAIAIASAMIFDDIKRSNSELTVAYEATIKGWSRAMDLRDKETEGHTQRVAELTIQLAKIMGIPDDEIIRVRHGALLHDVGKLGIPDGILLKPGPLTDEEWIIMREHPTLAYEMLRPIDYLLPALDIPYCHHEWWDGSGYPRGLKGKEIPLSARIFAIVDVFDALTSDRPYRNAWSKAKTLAYIHEQSGTHFDPELVEVFLSYIKQEG